MIKLNSTGEYSLKWQTRNFAVSGSKMYAIPAQLTTVGSLLTNVTHIVFTSDNDLGVGQSIQQVVLMNNATAVEKKIIGFQSQLVSTYKISQNTVHPGTKIHTLRYVDFISVGNKIPNEDKAHQAMKVLSNMIKFAAEEVNLEYIEAVGSAFRSHEMYSADPYAVGFNEICTAHPNTKGKKYQIFLSPHFS
jgi:hypothetical protein